VRCVFGEEIAQECPVLDALPRERSRPELRLAEFCKSCPLRLRVAVRIERYEAAKP